MKFRKFWQRALEEVTNILRLTLMFGWIEFNFVGGFFGNPPVKALYDIHFHFVIPIKHDFFKERMAEMKLNCNLRVM